MRKLTASNLISFIDQLDKNVSYNYVNSRNRGLIAIDGIDKPEGPIRIKRWNPSNGESMRKAKVDNISGEMLWRVANALVPNQPITIDRVVGASYNTRSVLEALLVHTPEFYYCYPGRMENKGGETTVKHGHKHLIWLPDKPHKNGVMLKSETDVVISEMPAQNAFYDSLVLPDDGIETEKLGIEVQRRHAQIQIALYFIGKQLNYRTWIAQNDKGILYQDKKIGEYDGVIQSLKDERLFAQYDEAIRAALMIDCIWFRNGKLMPAVMEIEHSTGVTSGLTRMKNLKDNFLEIKGTRYVVVAPDEIRDKVIKEANKKQFADLDVRYFPYSAVEELYSLCQRRDLKGVTDEFLDCYIEPILN